MGVDVRERGILHHTGAIRQIDGFSPNGRLSSHGEIPGLLEEKWASVLPFRAGETIYKQGDDAAAIMLVRKGRVRIVFNSPEGGQFTFPVIEGATLGEEALAKTPQERAYITSATAESDCTLLSIGRLYLPEFARKYPTVMFDVLQGIAQRQRTYDELYPFLLFSETKTRVARSLLNNLFLDCIDERRVLITRGMTQHTIASEAGATREGTNKLMSELKRKGILRNCGGFPRRYQVLRVEELASLAWQPTVTINGATLDDVRSLLFHEGQHLQILQFNEGTGVLCIYFPRVQEALDAAGAKERLAISIRDRYR